MACLSWIPGNQVRRWAHKYPYQRLVLVKERPLGTSWSKIRRCTGGYKQMGGYKFLYYKLFFYNSNAGLTLCIISRHILQHSRLLPGKQHHNQPHSLCAFFIFFQWTSGILIIWIPGGDWAGAVYTQNGCPGTCTGRSSSRSQPLHIGWKLSIFW